MFQKYLFLYVLAIIVLFNACSNTANFKNAVIEKSSSGICIKVVGKRKLMSHSPSDFLSDNTYIDSLLIYTPQLIEGETGKIGILVPEGYYKMQGKIIIKGKKLTVEIFIANTEEKRLVPSDWKGDYDL